MDGVVGIDVSKGKLAVVLLAASGKAFHKSCANTPAGHADLVRWLTRHVDGPVRIGLEATGGYQEAVALVLHDAGHLVSVLNPSSIAAYGRSQLRRAKTDPTDAGVIADYVRTQTPGRRRRPKRGNCRPSSVGSMRCSRCGRRKRIAWSWPPRSCGPPLQPPSRIWKRKSAR